MREREKSNFHIPLEANRVEKNSLRVLLTYLISAAKDGEFYQTKNKKKEKKTEEFNEMTTHTLYMY